MSIGEATKRRANVLQKLNGNSKHYPQMLEEKFPHVFDRTFALWGSSECERYLNDLLNPHESGGRLGRAGFPQKAWYEILRLLEVINKQAEKEAARIERNSQRSASVHTSGLFGFISLGGRH